MSRSTSSEAKAIRAAAKRLLEGRPITVTTDRLSVVELAKESGVDRNRLYRVDEQLKNEFIDEVAARSAAPPPATPRERDLAEQVTALEAQRDKDQALIGELSADKTQWKEAAEAAFRIINLLEVERDKVAALKDSRDLTIERLTRELSEQKVRDQEYASLGEHRASVTALPGTQERRVEGVGDPSSSEHDPQ